MTDALSQANKDMQEKHGKRGKKTVIYYPRVNPIMVYKKLYRCPACGDVLTDAEYDADCATGGGYCYCQFKDGDRILTGYDVYLLQQTQTTKKWRCMFCGAISNSPDCNKCHPPANFISDEVMWEMKE